MGISKPIISSQGMDDYYWMERALQLAFEAEQQGEVPVGALLVQGNQVIAEGWNCPINCCDPTAHAEIVTLRRAAQMMQNYRLLNTCLYVTLEPCAMCLGAMLQARVPQLVFGAKDIRAGAVESVFQLLGAPELNHRIHWRGGVLAEPCGELLRNFFKKRR